MSSIRDKMYNYETTPPEGSWEKIAAALDESALDQSFPSRLYDLEIVPPAGAWKNISESLDPAPAKLAPVRRLNPLFRYAAAAVLVAAVAYGIIRITTGESSKPSEIVATGKDTGTKAPAQPSAPFASSEDGSADSDEGKELSIQQETRSKPAPVVKRSRRTMASTAVMDSRNENPDNDLSQSLYAYADHIPDIADRYVMLMTPDGHLIRMAKKWSDLLCCVSGEEQDADCKNQLKKWQEKLAASTLAPSPGNFMDIVGLVKSLNDNREL